MAESRNFSIQPFNSISRYTFESEIRKPRSQPFNGHLRGIPILFFGLRFPEISRFNHSTAFRAIPSIQKPENPEVNHSTAICAAYLFFFSAFDFQKFLDSTIQQHFALYLRIRNQKSQKSTIQLPFVRHTYSFFGLRFPEISRFNHSTAFRAIPSNQKSETQKSTIQLPFARHTYSFFRPS